MSLEFPQSVNLAEKGDCEKKEKRYHFEEEMKDLEKYMIPLVMDLKERIDKKEYDVLISDETGARIPTLVLKKIINARGGKSLAFFVTGGKSIKDFSVFSSFNEDIDQDLVKENTAKVEEFFEKLLKSGRIKKKALYVTEVAFDYSGSTFQKMANIMDQKGIDFDSAILSIDSGYFDTLLNFEEAWEEHLEDEELEEENTSASDREKYLREFDVDYEDYAGVDKHEIFYGNEFSKDSVDTIVPEIRQSIRSSEISGVTKERDGRYIAPHPIKNDSSEVRLAREDVDLLAKKIIKKIWKEL